MYRIAVCDDEPVFVGQISKMTEDILSAQGESCEIYKYSSAAELKTALEKEPNAFDIVLLDILLGNVNGIKFTEYLRDTGNRVPVIFISSSKDYILDAYCAEPVGYVMKPVDRAKLREALKRAVQRLKPAAVVVDSPSATVSFNLQDVLYIEVFNKNLLLHMLNGTITELSKSLSSVCENLPQDRFVKCHRCYVVALSSVLSIKRYEITLKNNAKIPVSKACYKTVQERLQQYAAKWF
ncbi:MAG: response regulator transcription factor [Clostridiales bacterium]|nr:response regulator transcription factor [Clostridiales bacterium]